MTSILNQSYSKMAQSEKKVDAIGMETIVFTDSRNNETDIQVSTEHDSDDENVYLALPYRAGKV